MLKQIVITRFNDNIDWIYKLGIDYLIYDKKQNMRISSDNIFDLKNQIKDKCTWSHTMFLHIVKNYDCLADNTIFTKAIPWKTPNNWKHPQVDKDKFINKIIDKKVSNKVILCGYNNHSCDISGRPGKYLYIDQFTKAMKELNKQLLERKIPLKKYYYSPGGTIIVPKKFILNRSKKYYESIVKLLEGTDTELQRCQNNIYADAIERMLLNIFKAEKEYIDLC